MERSFNGSKSIGGAGLRIFVRRTDIDNLKAEELTLSLTLTGLRDGGLSRHSY